MKKLLIMLAVLALAGFAAYYLLTRSEPENDSPTYPGPPEYVSPSSPPPGHVQ